LKEAQPKKKKFTKSHVIQCLFAMVHAYYPSYTGKRKQENHNLGQLGHMARIITKMTNAKKS
jgi:hypothetical protein